MPTCTSVARDEALDERALVVLERAFDRARELARGRRLAHADARPFAARLHDDGKAKAAVHLFEVARSVARRHVVRRRRNVVQAKHLLGLELVHRERAREHAEPVYGMPRSSSMPCTQPSSPPRPWSARNATSMRASRTSSEPRAAGLRTRCARRRDRATRARRDALARSKRHLALRAHAPIRPRCAFRSSSASSCVLRGISRLTRRASVRDRCFARFRAHGVRQPCPLRDTDRGRPATH